MVLDTISMIIALVLGTAGLPHILMRFFTVKDAKTARSSVIWATWIVGIFYVLTIFLGFGAAAFVGKETIVAANPAGNMAAPLLAEALGGDILILIRFCCCICNNFSGSSRFSTFRCFCPIT